MHSFCFALIQIHIDGTSTLFSDCCYASFTGNPDIKGVIYWPTQVIGEQSIVGCPATVTQENATRLCLSKDFEQEPVWEDPKTDKCLYVRETTQKLNDLTKVCLFCGGRVGHFSLGFLFLVYVIHTSEIFLLVGFRVYL